MRKVVLYIAMSLDGYIADVNGKVDWLQGQDADREDADTYSDFIKDVDTVLMGYSTYHQIVTELSPERWVYAGLTSYVFTHRKQERETAFCGDEIIFTDEKPSVLINRLKQEKGKSIWICGGAKLAQPLIKENLIDEYDISIVPTILGGGVRLFDQTDAEQKLKLIYVQSDNGITELRYVKRT